MFNYVRSLTLKASPTTKQLWIPCMNIVYVTAQSCMDNRLYWKHLWGQEPIYRITETYTGANREFLPMGDVNIFPLGERVNDIEEICEKTIYSGGVITPFRRAQGDSPPPPPLYATGHWSYPCMQQIKLYAGCPFWNSR